MSATSDEFDYVIVGAGAAGCVVANRLATGSSRTVCLIEAGPPDNSIFLRLPAGVYKASADPRYAWQFETVPGPGTANRAIPMPQGKTLGGSTAINGMNYNRGNAEDFNDWARAGNRGWSYAEILPYFKRSERRVGVCDSRYRGGDGLLPITDCDWRHPLCDAFIRAAQSLGLPRNPDYNAENQAGFGYYQRYIENGWRVSAARAFVRPIVGNRNVEIRTNAQATAVLFEGQRAVGIRYVRAPGHPTEEVKARREVILCAGAANTPKLLQLSGVGEPALLAELGIPLVHDLPAVGRNLQDHYMVHMVIRVKGIRTIDGRPLSLLREAGKWALGRPNILAISPSLVFGFTNSRDLRSVPDIQIDLALGNYSNEMLERFPVIKLGFYQLRPASTGYVRAASPDPFSAPLIQPNYLAEAGDQRVVIDSVRTLRRLLNAAELQPYYDAEELPGPAIASDDECLDFARQVGLTAYHLSCTCRMGPRNDPAAVVDDRLRVRGVAGLRIADASIMPRVPSANTSAAAFMIAEKASDIVLGRPPPPPADLGVPGSTSPSMRAAASEPLVAA